MNNGRDYSNRQHKLKFSDHAIERCQQRGIPLETVDLVYEYGTRQWSAGALAYSVDSKARRRMQRAVGDQLATQIAERMRGLYIIVSVNNPEVITVAHQKRRKRR